MKPLFLILALMVCSSAVAFAQDNPSAQKVSMDPVVSNTYYAAVQAYRVTIESANGMVSVLDVPRGVLLNVQTNTVQNDDIEQVQDLPHTFRGDLVIRTRRVDEVEASEGLMSKNIMAKAPVEMVVKNGVVVVEKVEPETDEGG